MSCDTSVLLSANETVRNVKQRHYIRMCIYMSSTYFYKVTGQYEAGLSENLPLQSIFKRRNNCSANILF